MAGFCSGAAAPTAAATWPNLSTPHTNRPATVGAPYPKYRIDTPQRGGNNSDCGNKSIMRAHSGHILVVMRLRPIFGGNIHMTRVILCAFTERDAIKCRAPIRKDYEIPYDDITRQQAMASHLLNKPCSTFCQTASIISANMENPRPLSTPTIN